MLQKKTEFQDNISTTSWLCVIVIYSFLSALVSQSVFAQPPKIKFKHLSNENGLSNSTIECIFQDHKGFIWFGTRDGLNRYDGYEIRVFRNTPRDSSSISDNYIRYIYEDNAHNLWVGTINGLNRFNPSLNNFKTYKTQQGLSNNLITSICEDNTGKLWVGTYGGGLNVFANNKFRQYKNNVNNPLSLSDDHINYILEDKKGNLWIATDNGLNCFDKARTQFKRIPKLNTIIRTITAGPEGILWLGTEEKGLVSFTISNNTIKQFRHLEKQPESIGSDQVRAVVFDKNKNLWVGGINGGLNLFDQANDKFYHYHDEPGNSSSLSQRTISALFEDKQGNLWIGTHRGGINLYSPGSDKFKLIQQEPVKNSLSYNDVKAFYETDDGNIFIGTDGGGLNYLNRKTNTFTHYKNNPYNSSSLGSDAVLHITEDSKKNLWIGTWGGGLNLFNLKAQTFKRFLYDSRNNSSISSNYIQKTLEDSKKNLWVGTYYGGLNKLDRTTNTFKRIIYGENKRTRMYGNNVISIEEDKQGNIWIGTDDGGLNKYDPENKSFSHYFANEEKKPDLRLIFVDSKGRLWIGQAGLYLYNRSANKFSLYTTKAGLGTEFIKGITEDEEGSFWISTSNGLTRFNPATLAFKKYNTADGLQGLEFEANAYLKTRNGEMFFGGVNGFNSFFPIDIKVNRYIPPVYLTDFQIFNRRVVPGVQNSPLTQDISLTKEINLNYRQSTFSFNFAALNYTASENNKYAYKLEGLEKDWNYTGNVGKASYTNLDPKQYIFRVRASNNDGIWNDAGATVIINIQPPFWETWWFRIIVLAIVLTGSYSVYQFKRKLELKELEEKKREEIHQTQLAFFTNISHEFRTPLSLILGPLEKLIKEDSNPSFTHFYTVMYRNAARLMSLINELMDFRKVEAGALKLKVISGNLNLFIDEVAEEFKDLAEEKHLKFQVKKNTSFSEAWFDRHILEKIVLNLVNNSLKYTAGDGEVTLELLSDIEGYKPAFANQLVIKNQFSAKKLAFIRVADNGIGISKESIHHLFERYYRITESHLGSGVGLAFVKSLTMLHKGSIYVSSERQKGTEIIIALPCDRGDYSPEEHWIQSVEEGGTRLESISYKPEHFPNTAPVSSQPAAHKITVKHILIVDDNDELRAFLRDALSGSYHISEAIDGSSGFEKAKEESPDLIISDVMMPGMNGIEFCTLIKEHIDTSHIPFLMLTAKDTLEAKIEGIESGADFYFPKPVSINLLLLTIKNIFSQRQKLKDHYSTDHHAEVKELLHSSKDKEFMDKLLAIIETQLINPDLDIEFLCLEIGMSRTKLYQKLKSITGQSIGEFIRTIRLRKAIEIMTHEDVLLTEVMYRVGIQTQSYFTKAFKKEFGKTPSQFLNEIKRVS